MIDYGIGKTLRKKLNKLCKKDKSLYEAVMNKIEEIANSDLNHYKNLRYNLKDYKRVHLGHFVLIFIVEGNKLYFENFDHHDNIY